MSIPTQLEAAREKCGLSMTHMAAFIGITMEGYRDLESYDDEVFLLSVMEFLRVCVALDLSPAIILMEEDTSGQEAKFTRDDFGVVTIAATLASLCGDIGATANAIEWEQEAVAQWLKDDASLGEMPLPALKDLGAHLGIRFTHVLQTYWEALGQNISTSEILRA